jgi:cobalt/nickel transport protein
MLSGKRQKMKLDKLQKKILIILFVLCILAPIGILLPMFFNAGDAWGEWSAQTLKDLIGYVPKGLEKYSDLWNAPLSDYTLNGGDRSIAHQSGSYIIAGIAGATLAYVVMLIISKILVRNKK